MSLRNAFNGGELSPQLQQRADLDVFARGCACVENFDIGQTGGVRRRRGFRRLAAAQDGNSRLFGYTYKNDERYLVEISTGKLRVYSARGMMVYEADSWWPAAECLPLLRTLQINSILLITCPYVPPCELSFDGKTWALGAYQFKIPPWRYREYRKYPIKVSLRPNADDMYDVAFDSLEDTPEATPEAGEVLRASYYTDAVSIGGSQNGMFSRVEEHYEEGFMKSSTNVAKGSILAVRRTPESIVYSCVEEFDGATMFVNGLTDPANYTGNFQRSSDQTVYSSSITELSSGSKYAKGASFRVVQGYWDIFTCISEFNGSRDFKSGGINPEDYPGHFVRGMMLGSTACKGAWNFNCSSTWYGAYEVRVSYESPSYNAPWEYRGESFSRNAAPMNTPLAGDESDEECYISLWLTKCRAYGDTWTAKNFPADCCGNCLTVASYLHDMALRYHIVWDEASGEVVDEYYTRAEYIRTDFYGSIETQDWSWCAFSSKYGFPALACIFNQRLVFAGTESQPQTLWLSQTDNIDNFDIIEADNGGMALTMSCQTQDPIRWMSSQNSRIMLGTGEGEYVVQGAGGAVMTHATATVVTHGFVGAANIDCIQCTDKLIFFERGAGRAMQYGYDYAQDAYLSADLTVFADHILAGGGGVVDGTFLRKPDAKAALVLANGEMALMTYNSMHQVNAWHRYTTAGRFLSVQMLPNGNKADSLYVVTERMEVREVPEGALPDPEDLVARYYIEVMDDESPYIDNGGRDYMSTLTTNALETTRLGSNNKNDAKIGLYIVGELSPRGLELMVNGMDWTRPARHPYEPLDEGWNFFAASSGNKKDRTVGFRVKGNRGLNILAIQG